MSENGFESCLYKAKESVTKFLVLLLLSQTPLHGYALMKLIRSCTGGWLKSTSGNIYPLLKEMEKQGLIKGSWIKEESSAHAKKRYYITDKGLEELSKMIEERRRMAKIFAFVFKKTFLRHDLSPFPLPFTQLFPPPFPSPFHVSPKSFSPEEIDLIIKHLEARKKVIEDLIQELVKMKEQLEHKGEA